MLTLLSILRIKTLISCVGSSHQFKSPERSLCFAETMTSRRPDLGAKLQCPGTAMKTRGFSTTCVNSANSCKETCKMWCPERSRYPLLVTASMSSMSTKNARCSPTDKFLLELCRKAGRNVKTKAGFRKPSSRKCRTKNSRSFRPSRDHCSCMPWRSSRFARVRQASRATARSCSAEGRPTPRSGACPARGPVTSGRRGLAKRRSHHADR
mmetsp:Transcript_121196/g.348211  ORF Transcript_121196/g.348211 Transcript_121196/m.348211 type:complete len:210 (+) Transcript_121196:261-890(+)